MALCIVSCSSIESDARKLAKMHYELEQIEYNADRAPDMKQGRAKEILEFEAKSWEKYSTSPETKEQFQKIYDMELKQFRDKLTSTTDFGNKQNPLYGKVYRDTKTIPELKHLKDMGGCVITLNRFSLSYVGDNENFIIIFDQFLQYNGKEAIFRILDSINVGKLKDNETYVTCSGECRKDESDDECYGSIIAIVIDDDKEFFDRIVKAWCANMKTGKIEPITNLKGIKCVNFGYYSD